jgi:hypothetical protein
MQIVVDVDINTSDTSTPIHNQISSPITRARVRQLNNQVSSLASYSSYLDNGNVYSVLLRRNDRQERNGVAFTPVTFRIPEQEQLVTAAPTTYGLGFRRANTFWKVPGVYFHMHQTSSPYHVGASRNHYFGTEPRCCNTLFWPIGPSCIMLSPIRTCPRVGARPNLPEVVLPHL